MRKLIAAVLCLFIPVVASAGSATGGKIHSLIFTKNGTVIFWTTGARSGVPGCAADDRWVLFVSETNNAQSMLSGLLAAYSAGKSISVVGTGRCDYENGGESMEFFYTVDSTSGTGKKIAAIVAIRDGSVKFYMVGARTDRPGCAADDGYVLTGEGKSQMLSTLLAAQASGKNVVVVGMGVCVQDAEVVQLLYTQDLSP
jgi:hypothetical protein